jgi:hypothetical protein
MSLCIVIGSKNNIIKNKKNQLIVKKKKKKLRTIALIQFTKQEYSSCNFFDFFHREERKMQP